MGVFWQETAAGANKRSVTLRGAQPAARDGSESCSRLRQTCGNAVAHDAGAAGPSAPSGRGVYLTASVVPLQRGQLQLQAGDLRHELQLLGLQGGSVQQLLQRSTLMEVTVHAAFTAGSETRVKATILIV